MCASSSLWDLRGVFVRGVEPLSRPLRLGGVAIMVGRGTAEAPTHMCGFRRVRGGGRTSKMPFLSFKGWIDDLWTYGLWTYGPQ